MGKPIIWSGSNAKLINAGDLVDKYNNSLTDGGKVNYTWSAHGLTSADVGRPVRIVSANQLAFAQADTAANAEVAGFIYAIIDTDTLRISFGGNCPNPGANVLEGGGNFGASTVYFLSPTTAGKITAAEPTDIGLINKPIAVGTSLSSFVMINYRGNTVGSTNARTQISLANNSTTNMQNCASYDAGSIEGWIYIDGTTDYRFYFNAPFSKYGAGGNYYISPSYVGDTPPAGFTITINSSGQSIVTLPSIAGFVSATCTYSLNAPAVGTNFPLALDSANLTNSGITGLTGTAATTAYTSGSGKVGETIRATSTSFFTQSSPADTSFYAVTNLSLTIPSAGIWFVGYNCSLQMGTVTGASAELFGRTKLRNNTDNSDICGAISLYSLTGTLAGSSGIGSCQSIINISSSKTIQVYIGYIANGGTPSVAAIYERADKTSPNSQVYATRIA